MAFARIFENPNLNQAQYDAGRAATGASEDNIPDGALIHIAGPSPNGGWRVVEVWETEEQAQVWDDRINPILLEKGIVRPVPETWPVHSLLKR
jgi:hypothetical protein